MTPETMGTQTTLVYLISLIIRMCTIKQLLSDNNACKVLMSLYKYRAWKT